MLTNVHCKNANLSHLTKSVHSLVTKSVNVKFSWQESVLTVSHSLTNRFHVVVCLFSNRSQMTSKCGKKQKMCT